MTTIKTALIQAKNILNNNSAAPQLEAEVLLAHHLKKNRSYLRAWCDTTLTPEQLITFEQLIKQRQQGVPIAYLTGQREFWSRTFKVSPEVLIPRPDTEVLIELCLALIPPNKPCKLLELGTGSGIIAITLAAERPLTRIIATDYSMTALAIAQENAAMQANSTIMFYHSDWFSALPAQHFDMIVSNPPYIAEDDPHLTQGDVRFEPSCALIAAEQGLRDIKIIINKARDYLNHNGVLLIEHGYNQQEAVQAIFAEQGYKDIKTQHDLAAQPRVTLGHYS